MMRRAAPADTARDRADLAVERNRLLFEALPAAVGVAVTLAGILAVVQSAVVSPGAAAAWFILLSAISLARLVVARSHQQQAEEPATSRAFERRFAWGAVAAGAAWGTAGLVLFPADVPHQVFLAFVVAGVSAGAVGSLAASSLSLTGFLTTALVPLAVRLLVTPGTIPLAMGIMTLLFLIFLVASGRRIGRMLNDNVRLRLEEARREEETRRTAESLRTNLEALQRLHAITASGDRSLSEKIQGILQLGMETFGVERGGVSRIEGDRYAVEHAAGDGPRGPRFGTIPLADTYCAHVYAADGPVAFHRASAQLRDDPAYQRWRFEAYIGTPIRVDGERYGTLSFAGAVARPEPFTELHLALIRILAEWIGNEMARQDAASRLAESEERVRLLLQSVGEGIYGLDADGRTTFVNPAAVAILGFEPAEILGRCMHDLVHHSRADGTPYPIGLCPTRRTAADGIPRTVSDEVLWTSYGHPVPVEYTTTPIYKGQEIVGTVVSFRDVTERKEYERRLRSTLAMQRAILDAANYAIIATDTAGVIHTFSRGAERMLGYDEAEMVGQMTLEVLHEADELAERARALSAELGRTVPPGFDALVGMARARGAADERRWSYVRKDGTRLPVLLSVTAVRDDAGTLLGYLAVAADLTERERIDRLKNEFVSTVSHELRTPLTSIRGSLGLVAGGAAGDLPARALELVRIAARNSERLILLINDILDVEKIESGKMDFSLTPQPVMPLVEQAAEANAAYAAEHGTRIVIRERAEDARVNVDEYRFAQAMANLLSNASKFSPPGRPVEIDVTAETRAAPPSATDVSGVSGVGGVGGVVRVTVTDHGPGIPEEFRPRIFQKFSQADSADDRRRGGTGLGLSITRALIERMGGRIDFETAEGRGTSFTIELPAWRNSTRPAP